MANNELILEFGLPGLNEIIKAAKRHHMAYAGLKKEYTRKVETELVAQGCIPMTPYTSVEVGFQWIESGRARDPDNIRAGSKFILDAMVNRGVIKDDSMKYIRILRDSFMKGSERAVIVRWIARTEETI